MTAWRSCLPAIFENLLVRHALRHLTSEPARCRVTDGGEEMGEATSIGRVAGSNEVELSGATLHWSPPPESSGPMPVDGMSARTVVEGLTGQAVTWSVTATSVHGTQTRTEPVSVPNPCP
jgi:hypothetical protein